MKRVDTVLSIAVPALILMAAWLIIRQPPVQEPLAEPETQGSAELLLPLAEPPILDMQGVAELWTRLVVLDTGGRQGSLQLARRLVADGYGQIVNPAYAGFAENEKINRTFLTDGFNLYDYRYWQDSFVIKELALELTHDRADPLQILTRAVHEAVALVERDAGQDRPPVWPRELWQRGRGRALEQSWLLAELLYQLGYETQVVALRDADASTLHGIVEVRRGEDVWLADPWTSQVAELSVERLAGAPDKLRAFWPEKPLWRNALASSILYTPSYPQDYCWRNQELARQLHARLNADKLPRFGEDPLQRQTRFLELRKAELGPDMRCDMMVWDYPFRTLLEDITSRQQPDDQPGPNDNVLTP